MEIYDIVKITMNVPYTENDAVLKESAAERLVDQFYALGFATAHPDLREHLLTALTEARSTGANTPVIDHQLTAGWDNIFDQYYLVIHDYYDPENLVSVLYERLVRFEHRSIMEEDGVEPKDLIDRYLGHIEKRERIDLTESKARLEDLTTKLKETVRLLLKEEFNEQDIEKISKALDRAYYEPITEILEGILVTIAGN